MSDMFVPDEVHKERMDICDKCEHQVIKFNMAKVCDKCGCFILSKTKFTTSECPEKKW